MTTTNAKVMQIVTETGIVDNVKTAIAKKNRIAMIIGFVFGGFVPLCTYILAHFEVDPTKDLYAQTPSLLVLGGLMYSAKTVFEEARKAFKSPFKAIGFVILMEGVMTFSKTAAISYGALVLLIVINGIAVGVQLVRDQKETRKESRKAR